LKIRTQFRLDERIRAILQYYGDGDMTQGLLKIVEERAREDGIWQKFFKEEEKKKQPHVSARVKLFLDSLKSFNRLTFHVDELHRIMLGIGIRKSETRVKILQESVLKGYLIKESDFRFKLNRGFER